MLDRHYRNIAVGQVLDEFRGNDVEDEPALEVEDNPGTATRTKFFRIAQTSFSILGQMWLLTTGDSQV